MKKLSFWLLILGGAAACPAPAAAEFTPVEKLELNKIVSAQSFIGGSQVTMADIVRDSTTEATRPFLFAAIAAGLEAEWDCAQALRHFANAGPAQDPSFGALSRADIVARAFSYVDSCNAKVITFANAMKATGFVAAISSATNTANNVKLSTFNKTLTYVNYQPPGFPQVVGPHGDYGFLADDAVTTLTNMLLARKAAIYWYGKVPIWPARATFGLREILRYGSSISSDSLHVLALFMAVENPTDMADTSVDVAAGSKIRDENFFRVVHAYEINSNPHGAGVFFDFAGRSLDAGINGNLQVVLESAGALQAGYEAGLQDMVASGAITADVALQRIVLASAQPAGAPPFNQVQFRSGGWSMTLATALSHAWEADQALDFDGLMFFHAIPAPPCAAGTHAQDGKCVPDSPTGGLTCAPGTHIEGTQCVADPCPTCPPPVSCAPGTHLEGTICVADPCPVCPPAPVCPTFVPVLDYLPDRIQPRCIPQ